MKTKTPLMAMAMAGSMLCLVSREVRACSTFVLRDGQDVLYGKNFDFFMNGGYVMTNRRGVCKTALVDPSQTPVRWVSKYGSLTFNQVGQEFPYGGMNEAGLVVENMWLRTSRYPAPDGRPAISELQWIQYQLDNCASVVEVLASDSRIRIESSSRPIHFLVADRSGAMAAIEFLDGTMVVHSGSDLGVSALTNSTYDESLAFLALHEGFGGKKRIVSSHESLDRFATIAAMLRDHRALREKRAVRRAFEILDAVAQGDETVWSVVYDLARMRIMFKSVVNKNVRTVRTSEFDFDCAAPSRALAVDAPGHGNVDRHSERYTTELNRALVRSTFARYREAKFVDLPESDQEYLAGYPGTFECRSAASR
jgi:choloylglycine hydrolase